MDKQFKTVAVAGVAFSFLCLMIGMQMGRADAVARTPGAVCVQAIDGYRQWSKVRSEEFQQFEAAFDQGAQSGDAVGTIQALVQAMNEANAANTVAEGKRIDALAQRCKASVR